MQAHWLLCNIPIGRRSVAVLSGMTDWRARIAEINPEALFIGNDGETHFDEAIIGIGERCGQPSVLVYDYRKLTGVYVKLGMSEEEAVEWIDFNVAGAWMGPHTPIMLYGEDEEELPTEEQASNGIDPITSGEAP